MAKGMWLPEQGFTSICPKNVASLLKCGCKKFCSTMACSCEKSGVNCTECCKCGEECENLKNDHHSPYDTDSEASSDHEVDSDEE